MGVYTTILVLKSVQACKKDLNQSNPQEILMDIFLLILALVYSGMIDVWKIDHGNGEKS